MSTNVLTNGKINDPATATLGDVLYADTTKAHLPETAWTELLEAIAGGDQIALHALYDRAHGIVFTLMMRMMNNRETAEELTVDVFHEIWKTAGSYEASQVTVVGWIMTRARSRAIDRLRFEQRKKRTRPALHEPDALSDFRTTDDALEAGDRRRVLREALTRLTAPEREAIEAAFFCGSSYADVAARLNEPLGTIKTRIRSGLSKLRLVLGAKVESPKIESPRVESQ